MLGFNMSQIQSEHFKLQSNHRGSKGERRYHQMRDEKLI